MPIKLSVSKEQVLESYHRNKENVKTVASELGISVPTVYRYVADSLEETPTSTIDTPENLRPYVVSDKDPEIVGYKPRSEYLKALRTYMEKNLPVLLIGEAGTGKTSLARYFSYENKLPFLEVSCDSLLGFRELLGQVNITDGTSHFIEGIFTKFIQNPSVVLLDEITALDPGKNFMLHQLLQTREFFIKEANRGEGKAYRLHERCKIILGCNPPNAKYPGTNRLNVALVDRPQVIWMDELTPAEIKAITPEHPEKDKLLVFYKEAKKIIVTNNMRTTFSLRGIKKVMSGLESGMSMREALHHGFLNGARATSGDDAYLALLGIAKTIFAI